MGAGIGSAMVFVLFTYGGWNDAAYISAEVPHRRGNMVRALLLSIGIVTLLYLLVNLAYLKGLGYEGMARSDAVAADLMKRSEEHTSELQSLAYLVCRLLLEKNTTPPHHPTPPRPHVPRLRPVRQRRVA